MQRYANINAKEILLRNLNFIALNILRNLTSIRCIFTFKIPTRMLTIFSYKLHLHKKHLKQIIKKISFLRITRKNVRGKMEFIGKP